MGAYHIWDMEFKTRKDIHIFEDLYTKEYHTHPILMTHYHLGQEIPYIGTFGVVYNVEHVGYAEAHEFLRKNRKELKGLIYFAQLPYSDRFCRWVIVKGKVPKHFKPSVIREPF